MSKQCAPPEEYRDLTSEQRDVLLALAELDQDQPDAPICGLDVHRHPAHDIEERTLYRALDLLAAGGMVEKADASATRNDYQLTRSGWKALRNRGRRLDAVIPDDPSRVPNDRLDAREEGDA